MIFSCDVVSTYALLITLSSQKYTLTFYQLTYDSFTLKFNFFTFSRSFVSYTKLKSIGDTDTCLVSLMMLVFLND